MNVPSPHNTSSTPLSACASGFRVFIVVVTFLAVGAAAGAAEPRPSWECLPEETLLMVRVPGVKGFLEAVGSRTKFGAVLMQPDRLRKMTDVFLKQIGKDAGEDVPEMFSKQLGKHGLSPEDLAAAVSGEFGAAAIARGAGGNQGPDGNQGRPLLLLVGWTEASGQDAAERLFAGIGSLVKEAIEATGDAAVAATRTDLEMAGRPTIWVRSPIMAEEKRLGTTHLFVTRMDRRLLFAGTMAVASGQMRMNVKVGSDGVELEPKFPDEPPSPQEVERNAEAIGERARESFERFLVRHGEADAPSPLADLVKAPAMQASLPSGVPLVEVIANPPVAANLLGKDAATVGKRLGPFGIDAVGPIAWRQSFDGDVWRSNAFVTLPAPRRGLARLLDEEAARSEVPAFVTREPVGFRQVSLDLGKAYAMVKEAMLQGEEPPPGNAFSTGETLAVSTVGMGLSDLLSALGTQHWIVSYPSRFAEAAAHARRVKAAGGDLAGDPPPNPIPTSLVWQLKDEKPFAKLLELAGQAGGGNVVDEQGFRSVRFPGGISAFLGQGHLVLAFGDGVAEKTLAAIRNPPGDDAAFCTSDTVRRARELVPPRAGGLYAVADNQKSGGLVGFIVTMLAASSPDDVEEDRRDFLRSLQALLPSPQDMEGMLGAATSVWWADDQGIVMQSASEMPAP